MNKQIILQITALLVMLFFRDVSEKIWTAAKMVKGKKES